MADKVGQISELQNRVNDAAYDAQTAATRLQIATDSPSVNKAAENVKEVAHNATKAIDSIVQEHQDSAERSEGTKSATVPAEESSSAPLSEREKQADTEQTAKISVAAKQLEDELKEITETMEKAAEGEGSSTGKVGMSSAPLYESTIRAVKALELLARKRAGENVQLSHVMKIIWMVWAVICVSIVYSTGWIKSSELWQSAMVGICVGVMLAGVYHYNRRKKNESNQRFAMIPGAKGIQYLVHHIPSWISFSEREKVEWLNRVIAKAWPFYDAAICAEVKKQVEPLLKESKPAFIKSIFFQKLTFGDAPFRVEGVRVYDDNPENVKIDIDFRWAGDMVVHIAIQLPAGGSATRMVPKVSDVAVSGTARIILMPLVPEIPGFGAATVSLMQPPIVKFHLDFGAAFGGSYSAKMIQSWLDPFLRSTVSGMLVWPRRIVVPLLSEDVTGPLDDLYLRHKAALQVDVISATDIPRMDTLGKTDPFVEVYTQAENVEKTKVKKNTLNPVWNERIWVLVQEPDTQQAYITVSDVDTVNIREIFRLNVLKGATEVFGSKELIGRAKLQLADFVDQPGKEREVTLPLGTREFGDPDGCGGGSGTLKLRVTYWPLEKMGGHLEARYGALIVTLHRCDDLAVADVAIGSSDPYVKFTCNGKSHRSDIVYTSLSPRWFGARFDWFKVPAKEKLFVEVWDFDRLLGHDLLGRVTIDVHKEVASAPHGDITKSWGLHDVPKEWSLSQKSELKQSTITMRLQWIPFSGI